MTNDELKKWRQALGIMIDKIKEYNSHYGRSLVGSHREIANLEYSLKELSQARFWLGECIKITGEEIKD